MFGYVTIRKDDLKVKDYNKYQAYYCGLCQDIKEAYGKKVKSVQALYAAASAPGGDISFHPADRAL